MTKINSLRNVKIQGIRYKKRVIFEYRGEEPYIAFYGRLVLWLRDNCIGRYRVHHTTVMFENKHDAILAFIALG